MNNLFTKIIKVYINRDVLVTTEQWLVKAGKAKCEAFVLWAGIFKKDNEFLVDTPIFPEQVALYSDHGVGILVEGEELYSINKWLYENGKKLLGQVHSHPTHAFHSSTDDTFPIVNTAGQLSIVVPFFGSLRLPDLAVCAIFRLNIDGIWIELSKEDTKRIFEII